MKSCLGDLIDTLIKEAHLRINQYRNNDLSNSSIEFGIPNKRFIYELVNRFEEQVRRRINPQEFRRPKKSGITRKREQKEGLEKLRKALHKLLTDNEKLIKPNKSPNKALIAKMMNIGSKENRTASMTKWLAVRKISLEEEVDNAIKEHEKSKQ